MIKEGVVKDGSPCACGRPGKMTKEGRVVCDDPRCSNLMVEEDRLIVERIQGILTGQHPTQG